MNDIYFKTKANWMVSNLSTDESRLIPLLLRMAIGLFLVLGLTYFYYHVAWVFHRSSDSALGMLWGSDIVAGNYFLKDWFLPWDNYYTLDTPFYVLGIKLFGFDQRLMFFVPSLIYSLLVSCSLFFIYKFSDEKRKSLSLLLGLFWLLFPSLTTMSLFSQSPLHIVTTFYVLLMFYFLCDCKKLWRCCLAVIFLTLCNIGDPLSYMLGNLTLLIAAVVIPALSKKEKKSWIAVAILSLLLATVIKKLINLVGFHPGLMDPAGFANFDLLARNFGIDMHGILSLFDADIFGQPLHSASTDVHLVHLFLFALGVGFVFQFLKNLRHAQYVNVPQHCFLSFLAIANVLNFVACITSNQTVSVGSVEHLIPNFILFAIFSAIQIPKLRMPDFSKKWFVISGILFLLLILNGLKLEHQIKAMPRDSFAPSAVEQYLLDHHLSRGYGFYWSASVHSARTANKVQVHPVWNKNGFIVPLDGNNKKTWYEAEANFLILENSDWGNIDRDTAAAIKTFGQPQQIVPIDQVRILVWNKNIAPQLRQNDLHY